VLINELLVVGNDGLGDGLTDGVNLGSVSTTSNPDANVDTGELVEANDQEWFVDLESQDLGLDEVERLSVDLNKSLSCLFPICQLAPFIFLPLVSSSDSYLAVGDGRSCSKICQYLSLRRLEIEHTSLLLAEALHAL
jgi:hypothetical protein